MVYLDTSVLVPLFLRGSDSALARTGVSRIGGSEASISSWGLLEFCSVVGRRIRSGGIEEKEGYAAVAGLERLAHASLVILTPAPPDFEQARDWTLQFASGLRAADGLHLALAARTGASMFTFDKDLQAAARRFGVALYR